MGTRLDPAAPSQWHDYYRAADERRRRAGWRRRSEGPAPKRRMGPGRILAIVMGLGAVAVVLCLVLPA